MSKIQNSELEILKTTFDHLESVYSQWEDSDLARIEKILELLDGEYSKEKIKNAYSLIKAEYAILQERNLAELIKRIQLQFQHRLSQETATNILHIFLYGTTEVVEDSRIDQQIQTSHGLGENTDSGDEVEGAFGRFGYDISNPIPIQGIDKINDYFAKLRLNTGESITYNRIGSFQSDLLPYLLDKYAIFNTEKKIITELFIYAYHGKNSNKIPQGFIFGA